MGLSDCLWARAGGSGLQLGPSQVAALEALARIDRGTSQGAYLYGPAGSGKTWLLDTFVACAGQHARRMHWSEFFTRLDREVGLRLSDPARLPRSFDAVLGDCRLLGLDEVQISDPDDAGLVEHLLIRLTERRTRLIATSNQAPEQLLPSGPWRHWADGVRRRIRTGLVVLEVNDGVDYRALGAESHFATSQLLPADHAPASLRATSLQSGGRPLPVSRDANGTLWADFHALLAAPTGRQDYLLMCRESNTIGLAAVPALEGVDEACRQRFVVLVDIIYDTDTRLLLCVGDSLSSALLPPRTASRLSLLRHAQSPAPGSWNPDGQ